MIPLARPALGDREVDAVAAVLRSGMLVQGPLVERFEALLAERCARRFGVAVSSGTAALQLTFRALGVGREDAVVVPALTWPSPAHAAAELGARVRLVDVDPAEWNAPPEAYAKHADAAAAVVIDQFGNPARPPHFEGPVVEDAACALGSLLASGRPCGSLGVASCFSFHPRKILTTGEGGAILTDDEGLAEELRSLRNHGLEGPGRFRRPAANHRLTEMQGALGVEQMGRLDGLLARRHTHAVALRDALEGHVELQVAAEGARPNHQTLGAILPEGVDRDTFLERLRELGVQGGRLSYALHRLHTLPRPDESLEVTERVVDRGVALPLFPSMSEAERRTVADAVRSTIDTLRGGSDATQGGASG